MSVYVEKNKKTKKIIRDAFLQLLQENTFDTVTIGDITKTAKINRGTFYLHFQDKFDLLNQIEQELFYNLGEHIDALQGHEVFKIAFEEEQTKLAETLFHYIQLHSDLLKIFLSNHGRAGFHYRFKEAFMVKVRSNLEKNLSYKENLNVPFDYFLSFITSAFLGLIEQWVQNNFNETPDEMTKIYIDIISFIQNK